MKKNAIIGIGMIAAASLLAGCAGPAEVNDEPVTITFQSLAWQEATIEATAEIVEVWNAENPGIQVEIVQGSWDNVNDQLVTQFQGGTAPDVIHFEAASLTGFAEQGYLADLAPYLSDELATGITEDIWGTVTAGGGEVIGVPTLLQSYVVYANADAFAEAGIEIPVGDGLEWDELQPLAQELTSADRYGLGWGLKSPTATVMSLSLNFGGTFFETAEGTTQISVDDEELEVARRIHEMAYSDGSIEPVSLTLSGTDALPGFFGGEYAMFAGGNFYAQQLTDAAPEGFNWVVLPPLAGSAGTAQAANPQTLSVAAESPYVEQAAAFINYFTDAQNLAKLGMGDWLIPTSAQARAELLSDSGGAGGWDAILKSGEQMTVPPYQHAVGYGQWKDQIATPALQQYFANAITLDELQRRLEEGFATLG